MNLYKYPRSTCHVSVGIDTQYISRNPLVSKITFFCLTKISVPSNDDDNFSDRSRTSLSRNENVSIHVETMNRLVEWHVYLDKSRATHLFRISYVYPPPTQTRVSTNTRRFIPLSVRYYLSSTR